MSMKNYNDTIWNRTCDLLACGAVPQPTAPPAACPQLHNSAVQFYCSPAGDYEKALCVNNLPEDD